MADSKLPALTPLGGTPADDDLFYVVDVSDSTHGGTGTNKNVTRGEIVGGLQAVPAEGAFVDGDKTKLDGVATSATANPSAIDNVVEDTTPQLGGNLDLNGNSIVTTSAGDINLSPDTTGKVNIDGDLEIDSFGSVKATYYRNHPDEEGMLVKAGDSASGTAGDLMLQAGIGTGQAGGNVELKGGNGTTQGFVAIEQSASTNKALLDVTALTADRTITFPNADVNLGDIGAQEGTSILSTGETGGSKFLREDGDGTSSWQSIPGGGDMLAANNLSDLISASTARTNLGVDVAGTDNAPTASTTVAGKVELATDTETTTGTDATRAVTPAGLKAVTDALPTGGVADVVDDTTPQLGGNLDVNGNSIVSVTNGDINLTPNGTGSVVIDGIKHPQADGTSGQVLQTDGAGQLSFATPASGGGGGQSPYTYIIGTGGDYATLNAYVADSPASGDSLYIKDDHTLTADVNLEIYTDICITGNRSATITLGAYNLNLGANATLTNISFNKNNTGFITLQGSNALVDKIVMNKSAVGMGIQVYSGCNKCTISNNKITSTVGSDYDIIRTGNGVGSIISNNTVEGTSVASGSGLIYTTGNQAIITGNYILTTTGSPSAYSINNSGRYCSISNNTISSYTARGIYSSGIYCSITGNSLELFYPGSYGISVNGSASVITGNVVNGRISNHYGIYLSALGQCVTGNSLTGANSGAGIYITNNDDDMIISGNLIRLWSEGVTVEGSGNNDIAIIGNLIIDNVGTDINDSGTDTMYQTATDSDPLNKVV